MMQVMCKEDPTKICEGACGRGCASCSFHPVQIVQDWDPNTSIVSRHCPVTQKTCELTGCAGGKCCLSPLNPPLPQSVNTGWMCPRCSAVYAPTIQECWRCNANKNGMVIPVGTYTTTITDDPPLVVSGGEEAIQPVEVKFTPKT